MPFFDCFLFLFPILFWQAHLEGLEAEREELGQQIDHLLLENRGLLQMKMSLGLEVATYRYTAQSAAFTHRANLISEAPSIKRSVTKMTFYIGAKNFSRRDLE